MPLREGLVVSLGLLVGGCFLPAYQIASWTATGVSYMLSGKSVGDHALSLALNQDCATWRVLQGKEICVDYGGDFENSWAAMASTWNLPESDAKPDQILTAASPEEPVNALLAKPVLVQVAVTPEDSATPVSTVLAQSTAPALKKPVRGIDFGGLIVPEWAVGPRRKSPWQSNAFASRGLNLDGLVRVEKSEDIVVKRTASLDDKAVTKPAIYLVMGSFRNKDNAERLAAEHARLETTVSRMASNGRAMYRLLAGPIDRRALKGIQVDLAKAGIRNSWAVRLCRGSLAIPPCRPPVQQAALP